jgi:hypothetical protein
MKHGLNTNMKKPTNAFVLRQFGTGKREFETIEKESSKSEKPFSHTYC